MTDKELAEKVELANKILQKLDLTMVHPHTQAELLKETFSWPTFGLMVESCEQRGWELCIKDQYVLFGIPLEVLEDERNYKQQTTDYSIMQHGHTKATAMAFLETFEDDSI